MPTGVVRSSDDGKHDVLVARAALVEPMSKDPIRALSGGVPKGNRLSNKAGIFVNGYQDNGNPADKRHLTFKYNQRSHARFSVLPNGAKWSENYSEFSYDQISHTREMYGFVIQSGDFFDSQMLSDVPADVMSELTLWAEIFFGFHWAHQFSPNPAAVNEETTAAGMLSAMRGETLTNLKTVFDLENIGGPGGTECATSDYVKTRVTFLDKTNANILRNPNGAWTNASDQNVPTYQNLVANSRYWKNQNMPNLQAKIGGININGIVTLVPPGFFEYLYMNDSQMREAQLHVFEKGDGSTIVRGFDQVMRINGHYYIEWEFNHQDVANNFPGYSADIGNGLAVYACPTFGGNAFMWSMYNKLKFTEFKPDHHMYQKGAYIISGAKPLSYLLQGSTTGTTTERELLGHMVCVCPTQSTTQMEYE